MKAYGYYERKLLGYADVRNLTLRRVVGEAKTKKVDKTKKTSFRMYEKNRLKNAL